MLLNNLKSCEANLGDLSRKHLASIDELKKELTTCRFKNGHGIIDESYCRRDDIVATKQVSRISCGVCDVLISLLIYRKSVVRRKSQHLRIQWKIRLLPVD